MAALLIAVLPFTASCARGGSKSPVPAEVILEIYNAQSYTISAALVSATAMTPIGRVGARETRRWALPAQSGSIRVSASDSAGARIRTATLEPGKESLVRWEVRDQ